MPIEEIKCSITKVDKKKKKRRRILNSLLDFTLRLREIKRNGGNSIH